MLPMSLGIILDPLRPQPDLAPCTCTPTSNSRDIGTRLGSHNLDCGSDRESNTLLPYTSCQQLGQCCEADRQPQVVSFNPLATKGLSVLLHAKSGEFPTTIKILKGLDSRSLPTVSDKACPPGLILLDCSPRCGT